MPLEFAPITLERQHEYQALFSQCPAPASDYSFINLWGWAPAYGLTWAWDEGLAWIRQSLPSERYWAPVGPWTGMEWPRRMARLFPEKTVFHRVPHVLADLWNGALQQRVHVAESRNDWDYLYSVDDLKNLSGNRLHKKKNLVNQFWRAYPKARYVPLDSAVVAMALGLQEDWCLWRDCEASDMLAAENDVISRVFQAWDRLEGISGGALMVEETMVAYTVGEAISGDTLLIHFEKGHQDYKGCYQAINQAFAEKAPSSIRWVNREQDLGNPGLRKAKESYQPVDYVRKAEVAIG